MKIELYIPEKQITTFQDDDCRKFLNEYHVVQNICKVLVEKYGGATVQQGKGYYKFKNGEIISEIVYIVSCFIKSPTDSIEHNTVLGFMEGLAKVIKIDLEQECVFFTIDNEPFFI